MKIIVNGKEAKLKKDMSFELRDENPLFEEESEAYTMELEFPMDNCPENIGIFGTAFVKGADITVTEWPCQIIGTGFDKSGTLFMTGVTDSDIKCQFVEGVKGTSIYNTLITDLDYSQYDGTVGGWPNFPDGDYESVSQYKWTEFPVYDKKKEELITMEMQGDGFSYYSRHIFLQYLVQVICKVLPGGWTVDQSSLLTYDMYKYAVVVNTRNFVHVDGAERIRRLNLILPKITVAEFFRQIGLFFRHYVHIDVIRKQVKFISYGDLVGSLVHVPLNVNDDFEVEIQDVDKSSFLGNKSFKLPDDSNWDNINKCSFILTDPRIPHETMTMAEFTQFMEDMKSPGTKTEDLGLQNLYYLSDKHVWAIIHEFDKVWPTTDQSTAPNQVMMRAEILDQFSSWGNDEELILAPVPMTGPCKITSAGRYAALDIPEDPDDCYDSDATFRAGPAIDKLSAGERKDSDMYFDKLYIALIWMNQFYIFTRRWVPSYMIEYGRDPSGNPIRDSDGNLETYYYCRGFRENDLSISPYDSTIVNSNKLPVVDETKLYRFKFRSNTFPSAKSVFVIKGKEFVCHQLVAHFGVNGMSELIEGEFYEIVG